MTSSVLRVTVTFALVALCACAARGGGAQAIPSSGSVAGTYRVVVCRGACAVTDTAHALAWGTLVLGEGPIRPSLDSDEERTLAGFSRMHAGRVSTDRSGEHEASPAVVHVLRIGGWMAIVRRTHEGCGDSRRIGMARFP